MKVAITGSRSITDIKLIEMSVAESGFDVSEVISGGAKGIDTLAVEWAVKNDIPVSVFEARWNDLSHPDALIKVNKWGQKFDARAGLRRNELMAVHAEASIIIWDGKSKGTKHMLAMARKRDLPIFIYRTDLPFKTGHDLNRDELVSLLTDCERLLGVATMSGKSLYSSPVRTKVKAYLDILSELPAREIPSSPTDFICDKCLGNVWRFKADLVCGRCEKARQPEAS